MTRFIQILIFSFSILLFPLSALTPPPSLESQVAKSDYIALARLSKIKETKISSNSVSVSASVEILNALKGGETLSPKFDVAFMIFPEYYGKWLKASPQEGEYILFLIKKTIKDSKGKETEIIALYEPHPYAFREYSKELEEKIASLIKN
ncbi:hypothetical protein CH373_06915 [Leptospira perolatii]|uniref:Uncharacterized protein n=1 Tax=Leptospira perolatii TaxID=2023191 RepID=A0A2M9ZPT3_9LEPT|nr:hypothetical protein [Leptospira perolatii]PJZ70921.1 hypothetical protein CH360_03775 [Leptospira perolatii]PJZ74044.1 hypothetical protein CH373_06915 [Leptospira perolatii]